MIRILTLIALLLGGPGLAQTASETREGSFTARVTLSTAASKDTDFAEFLREEADDLVTLYKEIAAETPAAPMTLTILDQDFVSTSRYISVLRRIELSDGTVIAEGVTQDRVARDLLRLDGLLGTGGGSRALRGIADHVRKGIVARAHSGILPEAWKAKVLGATRPDTAVMQNFTLAPSTRTGLIGGLVFHFSPGEVAPATAGVVAVVVPASVFASGLNAEVASLFGGDPVRP